MIASTSPLPASAPGPAPPLLNAARLQLRPLITRSDHTRFAALLGAARRRADWAALPDAAAWSWLVEAKFAAAVVGFALLSPRGPRRQPQAWLWIAPDQRDHGYGSTALHLLHRQFPRLHLEPAGDPAASAWLAACGGIRDHQGGWRLCRFDARRTAPIADWQACIDACALALAVPDDYADRHRLRQVPEPERLHYAGRDHLARSLWLDYNTARAWAAMRASAASAGINLEAVSGFRSIAYQAGILRRKRERGLAIEEILKVNTAPGYSEHHSGRALDIGSPGTPPAEESFEQTPAFAWLKRHAGQFGFRLSYPRDNPHGVIYEPWHWCLSEDG